MPSIRVGIHPSIHPFICVLVCLLDIAAAALFMPSSEMALSESELRVAFDGDGVIFSDEAETVMKTKGLDAFLKHETEKAQIPLPEV